MGLVVGLTGANASGKGEVATWLAARGFRLHSLSDIVRERAADEGLPPERAHLIRCGNALRAEGGPGALAERILPRLGSRDVVDSIRNPAEVEALRRRPDFVLLGVRAGEEERFRRSRRRARPGDPGSLDEFRRRERQENSSDPAAQQLAATFRLADVVLENDGTLADLHAELERWLAGAEVDRPVDGRLD